MKCLACNTEEAFHVSVSVQMRVHLKNGKISSTVGKESFCPEDCHCWLCGSSDLELSDTEKQQLLDMAVGEF